MRRLILTCCLAPGLCLLACSAGVAQEPQDAPDANALVQQLASPRFTERQAATQQLRKLGIEALTALQSAADSENLEIRQRSQVLLKVIEQQILEQQVKHLLAYPDDAVNNELPGWIYFQQMIGTGPEARKIFSEIQLAEGKLLRLWELNDPQLEEFFGQRCAEIQYRYSYSKTRKPGLGSVAAVLLVGSDPKLKLPDGTVQTIQGFTNYSGFRTALTNSAQSQLTRKLLGLWISHPAHQQAYQKVVLAMRHNLSEGLTPAISMLKGNVAVTTYKQYALLAVAKLGDKTHVPLIEQFLDDETIFSSTTTKEGTISYSCQARDVALICLLHMTNQDAKHYGFGRLRKHSQYLYSLNSAGFNSEGDRIKAMTKWREWRDENKVPLTAPRPSIKAPLPFR